jgi:hypothetical protein
MPIIARRALGIPLICWTVRNPAQLRKAKAWTDQITFEGFPADPDRHAAALHPRPPGLSLRG